MEDIPFGERVRKFEVEAYVNGEWISIAAGTAIGHRHIKQIVPIKTRRLKLKVSESVGTPLIQEFSCYNSEKNSV